MKIKMEEKKPKQEKLTYEQLENVAHQLSEQNSQLYSQLQNMSMSNVFKRLDYLFKVLENEYMFSQDFVTKCAKEVEETITIPEESKESEETKEDKESK